MISTRLFQAFSNTVPSAKLEVTLHAFKQDPLIWNALTTPEMLERVKQTWPGKEYALTPALLGLFNLEPALLQNGMDEIHPSADLLETAMLSYEDYLQNKVPVSTLQKAGELALALYMKSLQNADWPKWLREIESRQAIESPKVWMDFWAAPFVILSGWLDDRIAFFQALLQFKQPEFSFGLLQHLIFSLPIDKEEQAALFKNSLSVVPLHAQVEALKQLRIAGRDQLVNLVAKGLLERHLLNELERKTVAQIWQSSEKSLLLANTNRELAALAQFAGEFETSEKLLKIAIKNYSTELAGAYIQSSALKMEQGISPESEIGQMPSSLRGEETVENEIAMLASDIADVNGEKNAALANLLGAEGIYKAGNESLAKQIAVESAQSLEDNQSSTALTVQSARALNWNPRRCLIY